MDVNILELDVWSWTKVQYMKGPAPKPRSDHCVCVSGKKLILSGGRGCTEGVYTCPFFMTAVRGPTFVFSGPLRTVDDEKKWTLAGVALLMQPD